MSIFKKINDKLNEFVKNSSVKKMYAVSIPFWTIVWTLILYIIVFIGMNVSGDIYNMMSFEKVLAVAFCVSIMFSLFTVTTFNVIKKSDVFWIKAKEFEKQVYDAETKKELEDIYESDFNDLKDLSLGGTHNTELHRLKSMMDIKYNMLK